ncbi:MAG: protease modulator HflC, partial [Limisphaerales bacterium]
VLVVIFILLLFVFQVRQTEVAVVTTFGNPTSAIDKPGAYLKWPWPIQKVYKFDNRIQNFQDKFSENLTADSINLLTSVYGGWRISDAEQFLREFPGGSVTSAQTMIESMLRSAKSAAVGKHPLSDFVNADPKQLKFDEIENDIERAVQGELETNNCGIKIEFLGIKKLGLPESVTEAVFARMKSERQVLISRAQNEGKKEAIIIRANADRQASDTLADASADATRIKGQGVAEAAKTLPIFQENPDLAVFLLRIDALQQSLNNKSILIFDQRTPPFDLFRSIPTNSPAH